MTRTEKWQTVTRIVAITAPLGAMVGLVPNVLGEDGIRSIVTGGLIGLLITTGMVTFEVSWAVELISRRWREAPFLVVLATRSLVWLVIIVIGIGVPLLTVNQTSLSELTTATTALSIAVSFAAALVINFIGQINRHRPGFLISRQINLHFVRSQSAVPITPVPSIRSGP